MKWGSFIFPPINLLNYPKQYGDYMINEESTVKPIWKPKEIPADPVNNPSDIQVEGDHYKKMSIEPWDVMAVALTEEEFRGYLKGNFIKYAMRDGKKPGAIKDADKAWHYKTKLDEVSKTKV